jgi:hypothetical protein
MTAGRIRAFTLEAQQAAAGAFANRHALAEFRRYFTTPFRRTASDAGDQIADLAWGTGVELLDWPSGGDWTNVRFGADTGFVRTAHLVEVAYVDKKAGDDDPCLGTLRLPLDELMRALGQARTIS